MSIRLASIGVALGVFLACTGVAFADGIDKPPSPVAVEHQATVASFAPDVLHGDNGLPVSPDLPPLEHGPIATAVDTDGNAIDAHEGQSVSYFAGRYYLYGVKYGCGTHIDLSDDAPFCGFSTYWSDDLMHWHSVDTRFSDDIGKVCASYCAFPKVVYSPRLHRYLMYFSSDNGGNINSSTPSSRWLAESPSPAGPWMNLREPTLLHGDSDAYDVVVGSDGHAYMFELKALRGLPTDVWAERLNDDYTGTSGNATKIATGPYHNVGAFQRGGYWYLTLATDAKFFGPANITYLRSEHPDGGWTSPDGSDEATPISPDSCGGTAQDVSVLPGPTGVVPIEMIDLYRSSPGDASPKLPEQVKHGDWNQAIAGRYWAPLQFDPEGRIRPITCDTATRIPLQGGARQDPPPSYQPDCRITADGYVEQDWTVTPGSALRALRVPVFQRAYVTSPALAPATQPPTALNAPLTIELSSARGSVTRTLTPESVSWAPAGVTLQLPRPIPGGTAVRLRLRTEATDGCYGVLVTAKPGPTALHPGPAPDARYGAVERGQAKPAPEAQMFAVSTRI
jgi:hypothetical protein